MAETRTALAQAKDQYQKAKVVSDQAFTLCQELGKVVTDLKRRLGEEVFADPQPGDRFTEMYAFWLYVIAREDDEIIVMHASAPCSFPEDGTIERLPVSEFKDRFYYAYFLDGGNNVSGWLDGR